MRIDDIKELMQSFRPSPPMPYENLHRSLADMINVGVAQAEADWLERQKTPEQREEAWDLLDKTAVAGVRAPNMKVIEVVAKYGVSPAQIRAFGVEQLASFCAAAEANALSQGIRPPEFRFEQ